jgi:hypothetical protein
MSRSAIQRALARTSSKWGREAICAAIGSGSNIADGMNIWRKAARAKRTRLMVGAY